MSENKSLGFLVRQWAEKEKVILGPHTEASLADALAEAGYRRPQPVSGVSSVEELFMLLTTSSEEWMNSYDEEKGDYPDELTDHQAVAIHAILQQSAVQPPADGGWVAVTERQPTEDFLAIYVGDGGIATAEVCSARKWINENGKYTYFALWGGRPFRVTHWQPLPPPPADKGKGE